MSSRVSPAAVVASLAAAAVLAFGAGAFLASRQDDTAAPTTTATEGGTAASTGTAPEQTGDTAAPAAEGNLTLTADQSAVAANADVRISGQVSPAAEGIPVTFERRVDGGEWTSFPVTTQTKADGTFTTVIRSGRAGVNDFRAIATVPAGRLTSAPVTITIS